MTSDASQVPLHRNEIKPGRPVPWNVYDAHGNLVVKRGGVIDGEAQLDALFGKGLFRPHTSGAASPGSRRDGREIDGGAHEGAVERTVTLDAIKLSIGDPFQIQAQIDGTDNRYYVRLIGYLKGRSVLVTVPEVDGRLCFVREGQAFVVRFFAGKNAYAFTANVLRSSNVPFPHIHLSYPAQVRGLMIRTGERVPVQIICAIALQQDSRTVSAAGLLTNLSVGGAMISSKTRLGEKGELLSIKFRIEIREVEVLAAIDATIRYVSRDESGDFLHGVQFAGLPNELAIALTAFVYQKLAEAAH
ncbi:flagellar brake protein [Accumulibacter sp.]|uniref:flagellar brake protein n=1 Tax=Accumulibacter sp. TaxID=2053492 RepID=UPI0025D08D29|nr:flagellar brake protein [Accumulibacter sp.]MCM8595617.1 flagellar brake protein [Accumulibacter sp.]MCM8627583.1 flagellar brake protein [Accumulibacter sp.]MDS4049764.1 flagellar brake protein [Accumulibacter sp.]